jgi:hypothetical protein
MYFAAEFCRAQSSKNRTNRSFFNISVVLKSVDVDGGSQTHTGSDPRQILSLLRLPVPPLRENLYENNMWKGEG